MNLELSVLVLTFFTLFSQSLAYFITVDAHAEECFFDKVEAGTKMGKCLRLMVFFIFFSHFNVGVLFARAHLRNSRRRIFRY